MNRKPYLAAIAVLVVSLLSSVVGRAIEFQNPIPMVKRNPGVKPPETPGYIKGLSGISGTPQAASTSRFLYAPDGTSPTADSVVGGLGGEKNANRCLGEMPELLIKNLDEISGAPIPPPPPITPTVKKNPADPAGSACVHSSCLMAPCLIAGPPPSFNTVACPDCIPECNYDLLYHPECMSSCLEQANYHSEVPEACKKPMTALAIVDGEQDLGNNATGVDTFMDDSPPLLAGIVPNPVDSFFPAISPEESLAYPVDTLMMKVADGVYQPVVLNRLPLDKSFTGVNNADFSGGVYPEGSKSMAQVFLNFPLQGRPEFYANPKYVNADAPLFLMMSDFGPGPTSGPVPDPTASYNMQNEANVGETFSWGGPISYTNLKNTYSQPAAIEQGDLNGDGKNDLIIAHSRIFRPSFRHKTNFATCVSSCIVGPPPPPTSDPEGYCTGQCIKDPSVTFAPSYKDYLSNYNKVINHYATPHTAATDPEKSYSSIEFKHYLDVITPPSPLGTPIQSGQQGYVTAFINNNGALPWKADQFKRLEDGAGKVCRFGVGPVPVDMVADTNFDDKPGLDLVVANFGEFNLKSGISTGAFATAGGITTVRDLTDSCKADSMATYAINPGVALNWSDPTSPVNIVKGRFNDDKYPDIAVGFLDTFLRSPLELKQDDLYVVPEIVAAGEKAAPTIFADAVECHSPSLGTDPGTGGTSRSDCQDPGDPGVIPPIPPMPSIAPMPAPFETNYRNIDYLNDYGCERIQENTNPANGGETLAAPYDSSHYDLFKCTGRSEGFGCPPLEGEGKATRFIYRTNVLFDCDAALNQPDYNGAAAGTGLPPDWAGYGCTFSGPVANEIKCTDVPGFKNWNCDGRCTSGAIGKYVCWGETTDRLTNDIKTFSPALVTPVATETWKQTSPVERDGIYQCGFNVAINKAPEFGVFMNDPTKPGEFNGLKSPHNNYVEVSSAAIERIVPDIPTGVKNEKKIACMNVSDCACGGGSTSCDLTPPYSYGDHRMLREKSPHMPTSIPLSAWPYAVAAGDLVDKDGNDKPDGLDDIVVGFLNSTQIALFPSQGGMQPFTNTKMFVIDAASPGYKDLLADMTGPALADITTASEKEIAEMLLGVFSGTNFLDIPELPINAFSDIDLGAEKRRGITAVHGFPIKAVDAIVNAFLGDELINQWIVPALDYELAP